MKSCLEGLDLELSTTHGDRMAMLLALGILLRLVETHEARWANEGLDARLKLEFVDSLHRILDAVERGGSTAMRMSQDIFAKDFAICLHRLIPGGGQLIDPGDGVPRRILVRPPLRTIPRKVWYMLRSCGGFAPFAALHTHQRMRHWFTVDGWEYCFRLLPLVFRSYPALKGVCGGSWFFDPVVSTISPTLAFVGDVSRQWGGFIVRDAIDSGATHGALEMSEERRRLHAQGKYQPVNFLMVAAKMKILRRARERESGDW